MLDERIKNSIYEACQLQGQSEKLANMIIAWLDAIMTGNESLNDKHAVLRHVEMIYENTEE